MLKSVPIRNHGLAVFLALFIAVLGAAGQALAAGSLSEYLAKVQPAELFAGADRFDDPVGEPAIAPVYKGADIAGYAYLNSDFTNSTGYSGKPIHIVVGIDKTGVVRGLKLVDHKEPIVLIGIPEARVVKALNSIIGRDLSRVASGAERPPQVDIVSGATVTVLVMGDSVVRSAVKLVRSGRLGDKAAAAVAGSAPVRKLDPSQQEIRDWQTLLGDGSIRSLRLDVGEVSEAFLRAGHKDAAEKPETADPADRFIDLYLAPVSVPTVGRSLLGEEGYARLIKRLKPSQAAILVAGDGAYSFKGSGYVRGGIFDRIELLQDRGCAFVTATTRG